MLLKHHLFPHLPLPTYKLRLKSGLLALLAHQSLTKLGTGMFGVFVPIFYYELFQQQLWLLLVYCIAYYLFSLLVSPLAAKFVTRIGMAKSLALGMLCYALSYFILSFRDSWHLPFVIAASFLTSAAYHAFYWLPYHVEFTKVTTSKNRGRILGTFAAAMSVIGIFTPILGGLCVMRFGYTSLIWLSGGCFLLSLPPLLWVKAIKETYSFSFQKTFRVLFSDDNRPFFLVYVIEGAESIVGSIIWPIFLFTIMQGNYVRVGLNAGLIVAVSLILELTMGYLTDKRKDTKLLHLGVGLSSLGWVLKALVSTVSQAVLASVYHSFALIILRTPFQAITYARVANAGHHVDEYTVLREISLSIGRVLMLSLCLVLIHFLGFAGGFLLAALATLGFNLITRLTVAPRLKTVAHSI